MKTGKTGKTGTSFTSFYQFFTSFYQFFTSFLPVLLVFCMKTGKTGTSFYQFTSSFQALVSIIFRKLSRENALQSVTSDDIYTSFPYWLTKIEFHASTEDFFRSKISSSSGEEKAHNADYFKCIFI